MKKILLFTFFIAGIVSVLFAYGEHGSRDIDDFKLAVQKCIEKKLTKEQSEIADVSYLYYKNKFNDNFTDAQWDYAIERTAKICKSTVIKVAIKTGKWGEKFIKALIVQTEELYGGFQKWLEKKSNTYDSKNKRM